MAGSDAWSCAVNRERKKKPLKKFENLSQRFRSLKTHPNLPLHRDTKQCNEVHDKYGPEDRNIENIEERADDRNCGGLCDSVPELELGKSPYEWPEFFIAARR